MAANKKLLMLPGDGIGPEVMNQVKRVIDWMDKARHVSFDVAEDLVGGGAYDAHGTSLTDGIAVAGEQLGSRYPHGLFVAQDHVNVDPEYRQLRQNFKLVSWEKIARALGLDHRRVE